MKYFARRGAKLAVICAYFSSLLAWPAVLLRRRPNRYNLGIQHWFLAFLRARPRQAVVVRSRLLFGSSPLFVAAERICSCRPIHTDLPPSEDSQEQAIALRLIDLPIEDELKDSYLTYAMSVIVSRALPDVRDGLKPSQRRILVAMNDLNLTPGAGRVKCAKISGDTSGNYHPHGESVIYPTLVRMAQEWNMRCMLIDKQGNFGSIAGLPPAAMRYTEARLSPVAATMLEDLKLDTVDFVPTYDERRTEPTVLPSKFPNLLVNGSGGIAVGMATSIPPHNLGEVCRGIIALIDNPHISVPELMEHIPAPDFPTGGIICGKTAIWKGYETGRSTIVVRSKTTIEERKGDRYRIIVNDIPYQQTRDAVHKKIADVANEGRIPGIAGIRDESDLKEPVRLVIDLKKDADPDIVLEPALQVHADAGFVLDHPAGAGRRQAADALAQGNAAGVRAASRDGDPPADAVPADPRTAAEAHRARPAAGLCKHRRSDPRDSRLEDAGGGERAA